ncbi:unnamed protein product [Phyllotreta striolata]|uniref:Uncharacterized protein n=1 Tax=Phyllotreta striolata TaxID=444603 RepID=A0A9N9XQ87_PHYSR|nr:unnamed protein product [Phyllotreta striolata]
MDRFLLIVAIAACLSLEAHCDPVDKANVTVKEFCIKDTKISPEKVKQIEDDSLEEADEEAYCYLHCLFVELELIDSKGQLNVKAVMEEFKDFDEACLKKVPKITQCTDMAALDECGED